MTIPRTDKTSPEGPWEFDDDVTAVFDNMLARSIPQYDVMRRTVFELGEPFVRAPGGHVVDLGTSRGVALQPFVDRFGATARYQGIEVSVPMLKAARDRYKDWTDYVQITQLDLRTDYPERIADVTLCVLTLQFVPIEHRQRILAAAKAHTLGAFILVEKVLGSDHLVDRLLTDLYYAEKSRNGYSDEDIDRKRLSLEGVLVPVTAAENERMLHAAGFTHVETFWRWGPFAGWVALP